MHKPVALSLAALPFASAALAEADPAWHLLGQIEVTEHESADSWSVTKRFPAEIENGVDTFEISGYLIAVGWEAETRDYMLVSDLGQCPFCGSGDHGTAIEVRLTDPLPVTDEAQHATLRGMLQLVRDPSTMQAVVMTDAVLLDG
ncbi:hypothetical protein [Jannaschia sp. M317]|uniref:hypothetical protein n=1 Tax=Jannaschia sp. M317 TaxID=2867011 RepID=UPI0021A81381|nr:hypothetical protein [Jannaschia sp. M317]UWQ18625.1 hypothetical protein K3551_04865 [Jannaschia sp. M317]